MENAILRNFIEAHSVTVTSFNLRLSHCIRKINTALHGIETSILSPEVEVDDLVKERERKMNLEFACRFSRNNLYSIHLNVSKLENEITAFLSNKHCKIFKSANLRAFILSLMSHVSHSTLIYEKFLRKSKLKCLFKLDNLMDYLHAIFQMMTYVVDTTPIETLDLSETISHITKLSRERKYKMNSSNFKNENKIRRQFSNGKKICTKLSLNENQFANKKAPQSAKMPKRRFVLKNIAHERRKTCPTSKSVAYRGYVSNDNSDPLTNDMRVNHDLEEKISQNFSALKIQKIYFDICNKLMHELVVEVSSDMNECILDSIVDAYKRELVNTNLR